MPTIDDLIEVLTSREVHGGDPVLVLERLRADAVQRRLPGTRLAAAAASATLVAAVAVTVGLVLPNLSTHSRHFTTGSGPSPDTTTTAGPSISSTPISVDSTVPITPQVAVQTLINLLPRAGQTSHLSGESSPGQVGGGFVYDDGHGAAEVSVDLSVPYLSPNPNPAYHGKLQRVPAGSLCSSQGVVQLHQQCTTFPDGSQVAVYQGDANLPGGAKDWEVSMLRTDGVEVDVTEFNSPVDKGGVQTRIDPPFTITELITIARSNAWQATTNRGTAEHAAKLFTPQHI